MTAMRIPGFTAELSLDPTKEAYTGASAYSLEGESGIQPQMRRITGTGNMIGLVSMLCDAYGGGLSSNGDGSVSCNFY